MLSKIKNFYQKNSTALSIISFGITGLIASWIITVEKYAITLNPNHVTMCDVNPLISCGVVMRTVYSTQIMQGYPNSWLGLMAYPMAIMFGASLFFVADKSAKSFDKSYMLLGNLFPFLAFLLSCYWLWLQMWVIHALCVWCLLSAISSTNIFFVITRRNILDDNLKFRGSEKIKTWIQKGYFVPFVILWFVLIFCMMYFPFFGYQYLGIKWLL